MKVRHKSIILMISGSILALAIIGMVLGTGILVEQWRDRDSHSSPAPAPQDTYAGQGVAYGIQSASGGMSWKTYQVPEQAPFRGRFHLVNQQPAETYLLTCLIDYRQVPCVFEGERQLLYEVHLGDLDERYIPFETPALTAGFHDFTLLAFAKPDVHDVSNEFRLSTDLNYLVGPRVVLLAGNPPWDAPSIDDLVSIQPNASQSSDFEGVVINRERQGREMETWLREETAPGEATEYYIHVGNQSNTSMDFAVITFMDYQQVSIDGQDQRAIFGTLPADDQMSIPAEVTAPDKAGIHEFMVIWIPYPFHMLEKPPLASERNLTRFARPPEPSIRVAVIVEE